MVKFNQEFIETLRERIPLSSVIGRKVKLQRKGTGQFLGLCPFHKEKTPSFTVNDIKGFYYCFGCGAHGDVITFEEEINSLSFAEAVEKLATEAGIPIPKTTKREEEQEKKRLGIYQVLELTAKFFSESLYSPEGAEALAYLKKRGLDDATINDFRLGYAPKDLNRYKKYMAVNDVGNDLLLKAGLVKKSEYGNNDYYYFHNRVMFPITDHKGKVIAFSGRALDDGMPKYLNSPDTEIFNKGDNLYGLSNALDAIRKNKTVILVEGNMDVISMVKAGLTYTVAPLGTALTEKQIQKIWAYAEEPCLCFDNDNAGHKAMIKAALRVLPILKEGCSLQFAYIDGVKDPDEYIKAKGKDAFMNIPRIPLSDVLWNYMVDNFRFDTPEKKAQFETEIDNLLANINNLKIKSYYKRDFDRRLRERLYSFAKRNFKNEKQNFFHANNISVSKTPIKKGQAETRILTAYCLLYPETAVKFIEKYMESNGFQNGKNDDILGNIFSVLNSRGDFTAQTLEDYLKSNNMAYIYKTVAPEIEMITRRFRNPNKRGDDGEILTSEIENDFEKHLLNFRVFNIEHGINEIKQQITTAEDNEEKERLWREYLSLMEERERLIENNF